MKAPIILLLIVGTITVLANPISKQEDLSNNKEPLLSQTSEPEGKLEDTTSNKSDQESKKVEIISEDFLPKPDIGGDADSEVDIVIEESVTPLESFSSDLQNEIKIDEDDYLSLGDQAIDNIIAERIKDEIMETAAGFAPIPLQLRKRHKQPPRRRFAIRRHFQRYPYASPYRRYPVYYPYYRFYSPSSLRFY